MQAAQRGESRRVVTALPQYGEVLRRAVLRPDGASLFGEPFADAGEIFEEWLLPPQRLILFGAGDDARPMVQMAALLGWSVTVVDGRAQWARAERFPEAERVIAAATLDGLGITAQDAVVVMSHSYEQDRAWLTALLPLGPRYLGLLGARHRSALLVSEAAAQLGWPLERACEGLFAPVGMDLGGDGAEAIALAVIAEVQACCEGKIGVSRRLTPEAVAAQIAAGGASRYLQAQCAL
jgi:xanthine/CO dehydrogenase XdhC/CoxF family maturation factor